MMGQPAETALHLVFCRRYSANYLPTEVDRIEIGPAGAELPGAGTSFDLVEGAVPGSGAVLVIRGARVVAAAEPQSAQGDFERQVAPILITNCLACHGESDPSGGLNLTAFPNIISLPSRYKTR